MKLNFRKVHCFLTQARGRHEPPVTNNVWKQDNIFSTHPPPFLFDAHTGVVGPKDFSKENFKVVAFTV